MGIVKLDLNNFDQIINNSKKPVIVDFYADWCGYCKVISPVFEEVAKENSDIEVFKLDIDECPEIAEKYEVMTLPTFISFKDSKEYKRNIGAIPKNLILDLVDKN